MLKSKIHGSGLEALASVFDRADIQKLITKEIKLIVIT
jgi:hypothetical protein